MGQCRNRSPLLGEVWGLWPNQWIHKMMTLLGGGGKKVTDLHLAPTTSSTLFFCFLSTIMRAALPHPPYHNGLNPLKAEAKETRQQSQSWVWVWAARYRHPYLLLIPVDSAPLMWGVHPKVVARDSWGWWNNEDFTYLRSSSGTFVVYLHTMQTIVFSLKPMK